MSFTTVEPGKQLYTILYQHTDPDGKPLGPIGYIVDDFVDSILTTDHDAVMNLAAHLVKARPDVIYTVSMVTPISASAPLIIPIAVPTEKQLLDEWTKVHTSIEQPNQ